MYKLSFDFPFGKTWLKSIYIDDRISCSVEIPEFTSNKDEAKEFTDKTKAENAGKFYAGKYGFNVEKI